MKLKTGKVEPVNKTWLSAREAKAFLDCSNDFLYRLRKEAKIRFSVVENKYYYDLDSLKTLISKNIVTKLQ